MRSDLETQLAAMTERAEKAAVEAEELTFILARKEASIKALEKDVERLADALNPYQWRPISEIHEDYGPCVLIDINDPGHQEIGSNLYFRFDPARWTHFAEAPKLSDQQANDLIAAMKDAGETCPHQQKKRR